MLLLLSRLMRRLSLHRAMALGRVVGWIWYYLLPLRRSVARHNVARVFGDSIPVAEQKRIVRRSMTHLCYYVIEGLRMPDLTAERSAAWVAREHMERVDALLQRGKGIIAVTAHIGNFDLLGTSQTVRGYPVNAILKDITWKQGQLFWQQVRDATGLGRIAPRRSKERIRELLDQNEIVAFLIDQHMAAHRAMVCSFFGQLAATTPAPVRFAFETGAPIMPIWITRQAKPGYHCIHVEPEFVLETPHRHMEDNIRHNTERLNRIVEGWIRAVPDQWLWFHKRWKVHDAPQGWPVPEQLQHLLPPQGLAR